MHGCTSRCLATLRRPTIPQATFDLKRMAENAEFTAYHTLNLIKCNRHEPAKTRIYIVKMVKPT